ncbi:MAG TPA: transcriptional regulator [Clostridium sp.]|nr:transcriptional regulator [Clostridium sp.]
MSELLKVSEVARALKVNVNSVYKLIEEGKMKVVKIGCLKVKSSEVERFINDHEVGGEVNASN